ncbi:hypothetical protein EOPP23_05725 [Endozoicomonas sp. OPT23]|uniref:hypothetical protein n=1 Tax=Endozoicomonas sp. OPT23 TaxID=2072845 RepID=UPI0018910CAC|nr:hypothetical protein [Endozoicomonas sp. OPT23]MRI32484.1 hypothetical protein [Endozoicomonas sp. OPT23]
MYSKANNYQIANSFLLSLAGKISLFILFATSVYVQAVCRDRGNSRYCIEQLNDFEVVQGSSSSDSLSGQDEYCIISRSGNGSQRREFDVQVRGPFSNSRFYLSNGSQQLPIKLYWKGGMPVSGESRWYEITSNNQIVDNQQGALSCQDQPYSQAYLRADVRHSDFLNATPGAYSGRFSVDLGNGSSQFISLQTITVTVPLQARISKLQDIDLTNARNGNWYFRDADFCVFVSGGRSFDLEVTGEVDNGRRFAMAIPDTSHRINYRFNVIQDNWKVLNGNGTLQGFTGSPQQDCGGGTNTSLRIDSYYTNVINKPSGHYRDVLTLTVTPK